jgi:hypothetical protein
VNISPSFGEFTAPLRHILTIHNVAINRKKLFVNFHWTFTFCIEKSYEGTHLVFGGNLDRRCHFKHVSLEQIRFYHCQTSTAHRQRISVDGSVATISIENFPIGLHAMHLYFPDRLRTKVTERSLQMYTEVPHHCIAPYCPPVLWLFCSLVVLIMVNLL